MSLQIVCFVIQLIEVIFLCRRQKMPIVIASATTYVVYAYFIYNSRRFVVGKFLGYLLAFGVAMHYVFLLLIGVYIFVWFIAHWWFSDSIYRIQSLMLCIGLLLTLFGYINGFATRVNYYKVYTDNIDGNTRIVHLSDLHISNIFDAKEIHRIVDKVNSLNPDIICITGDIFTNETSLKVNLEDVYGELSRLNPTIGTFVCQGNHDLSLMPHLEVLCQRSGFILLVDSSMVVNGIEIIGRRCTQVVGGLDSTIQDTDNFLVVMDHIPSRVQEAVDNEVDILLSGHTHGGQLLPITLRFMHAYGHCTGADYYEDTFVSINKGAYLIYPYCRIEGESEIVCIDVIKE